MGLAAGRCPWTVQVELTALRGRGRKSHRSGRGVATAGATHQMQQGGTCPKSQNLANCSCARD